MHYVLFHCVLLCYSRSSKKKNRRLNGNEKFVCEKRHRASTIDREHKKKLAHGKRKKVSRCSMILIWENSSEFLLYEHSAFVVSFSEKFMHDELGKLGEETWWKLMIARKFQTLLDFKHDAPERVKYSDNICIKLFAATFKTLWQLMKYEKRKKFWYHTKND